MLDIKFIRENPEVVRKSIRDRGLDIDLDELLSLDEQRRKTLAEVETLKSEKNKASKKKPDETTIKKLKTLSQKIDEIDKKVEEIDKKLGILLLNIPNLFHNSVTIGSGPESNKVIRTWGKIREFNFKPKTHIELGEETAWREFRNSGFSQVQQDRWQWFLLICRSWCSLRTGIDKFYVGPPYQRTWIQRGLSPFFSKSSKYDWHRSASKTGRGYVSPKG